MDRAPVGGRGEGQAYGKAARGEPVVTLGDRSAAKITRMGDSDSLSFNDGEEVQEWRPLLPKSIK